jgi:hypothetical protein
VFTAITMRLPLWWNKQVFEAKAEAGKLGEMLILTDGSASVCVARRRITDHQHRLSRIYFVIPSPFYHTCKNNRPGEGYY